MGASFALQGPIVEFVEQLTNNGGQWSMKVAVKDEATRQRHVFKLSDQVGDAAAGCWDARSSLSPILPYCTRIPFFTSV
jgi:hypothetical protein